MSQVLTQGDVLLGYITQYSHYAMMYEMRLVALEKNHPKEGGYACLYAISTFWCSAHSHCML